MSNRTARYNGNAMRIIDNGDNSFSFAAIELPSTKISSTSFTRPADTTAYTANDVVGPAVTGNLSFSDVSMISGAPIKIESAMMEIDVAAVPSGMSTFRLHIYNAAPTAIADNAAFNLIAADRSKYLGYITFSTPVDFGDTLISDVSALKKIIKLADNSTSLYGILETIGAYTPTSAAVKKITLVTSLA
ncbi:hypothetical protein A7K50_03230 [Dehalobacter sp. MCB1]|uniref:hypothetical protein n=1 Tax=Dehalobacter sp. MCB1 TaxID=1844756 RepID=UPI000E6C61FF|nr:hypothetical protein [Dehalobacter sp. MCB1]RJE47674.1 hypothetical protein A7K50_03230 [Dehalobacter sp. MCB1]